MRLPDASKAIVERKKIVDYLLNPAHPDNGGTAQFFDKLKFHRKEWKRLAGALRTLAAETEVTDSMKSPHGQKYVIIGRIASPARKSPLVRTSWIIDSGAHAARLVTAYPHEE
jgi:hypothetical protein